MSTRSSKGLWGVGLSLGAVAAVMVLGTTRLEAETNAKPATSRPACVDVDRTASRRVVAPNQVLIEDGFGRSALLTLSKPCANLDELDMIGFEFFGSNRLCTRTDMKILHSRNGEKPLTCLITNLKLMDREETKSFETEDKTAAKAS